MGRQKFPQREQKLLASFNLVEPDECGLRFSKDKRGDRRE
jgi:hypothetical protein